MKKLNLTSFLSGIGFTVIVLTIFAFTNKNESGKIITENLKAAPPVGTVSPATAAQYRNNFKTIYPGAIEAVNISVEQLDALNQTVVAMNNDLREVSGFRLYFGATSTGPAAPVVSIAYVINKQLRQNEPASNLLMAEGFNSKYRQQCPPFCD